MDWPNSSDIYYGNRFSLFDKYFENWGGIWEWFENKRFFGRIGRIIIPYTIMYLCQMCFQIISNSGTITIDYLLKYLSGGIGPGGYYTLIMLQLLILFPILFQGIKKRPIAGPLTVLIITVLYEFMVNRGVFRESFNRLCCIRLLVGVVFGIILYLYLDEIRNTALPYVFISIGAIFLIWYSWGGYKTQIVSGWVTHSFAGQAFSAGVVWWFVLKEELWEKLERKNGTTRIIGNLVSFLGKTTYHIMLFQQLWYTVNPAYRISLRVRYVCVLDVAICLIGGVMFYILTNFLHGKFKILRNKLFE